MAEHDPLDTLFEDARRDVPTPAALDALRARLPLPAPPAPPRTQRAALLAALSLLALVALFFGVRRVVDPPRADTAAAPAAASGPAHASTPAASGPAHPSTPAAARVPVAAPAAPPAAAPARAPDSAPSLAPPARRLPPEVELVEQAHAALRTGDLPAARRALARHRATYPEGMLVEEARSLEVELLVRGGDADGAARALAAFRRDYPGSAHLARLERLTGAE